MTINPTHKLDLSPEARAALVLPLVASTDSQGDCIRTADGQRIMRQIGTIRTSTEVDAELAHFFAALVNAAFTPAPAVTVVPETNAELGQLITTEFEAAERWTAADILEREG